MSENPELQKAEYWEALSTECPELMPPVRLEPEEYGSELDRLKQDNEKWVAADRKWSHRQNQAVSFIAKMYFGKPLVQQFKITADAWRDYFKSKRKKEVPYEDSRDLGAAFADRFSSLGWLALFAALFPAAFTGAQLYHMWRQTQLIANQGEIINQQTLEMERQNRFVAFEQTAKFREMLLKGKDQTPPGDGEFWPQPNMSVVHQIALLGKDEAQITEEAARPLLRDENHTVSLGAALIYRELGLDIRGADLRNSNLYKINLSSANFIGCDFSSSNFIGVKSKEANYYLCRFIDITLPYSELTYLFDINLQRYRLIGATPQGFSPTEYIFGPSYPNFKDASFMDSWITPRESESMCEPYLEPADFWYGMGYTIKILTTLLPLRQAHFSENTIYSRGPAGPYLRGMRDSLPEK